MSRTISFIAILFSCNNKTSNVSDAATEKVPVQTTINTCTQGAIDAVRDFKKNVFVLHSVELLPAENSYFDVLQQDYAIQWRFVGHDELRGYYSCYDSIMTKKLKLRYGSKFLIKAAAKADSLDGTGRWNSENPFPNGSEQGRKFIYSHINWQAIPAVEKRVFVSISIDSTGKLMDVSIQRGIDNLHDQEAIRVIYLVPTWKPLYRRGRALPVIYTLPIMFNAAMRHQYSY